MCQLGRLIPAPGLHQSCTESAPVCYVGITTFCNSATVLLQVRCEIAIKLVVSVAALKRNQQRSERLTQRRSLVREATNQQSRDLVQYTE